MKIHVLERTQHLAAPLDEVFGFFSDACNLQAITPPWVGFRIHTPAPIDMGKDTQIEYTLRLAGIPLRWRTRITEWDPPHRFVDVAERSPYALWEHAHTFESDGDGVRMTDSVRYALPFGPLGSLAHALIVRRALDAIFDYRRDHIHAAAGWSER